MEAVESEKKRCERLIEQISSGIPKHLSISVSSIRTLLRLVRSELKFLSLLHSAHNLSSNVGHLESVVHLLTRHSGINAVSRLCKPIPIQNRSAEPLHVDIVCSMNCHPVWIVVSDRNPKNLEIESFMDRIKRLLNLSSTEVPLAARPSAIIIYFARGVGNRLFDRLCEDFRASDMELPEEVTSCDYECFEVDDAFDEWLKVVPSCLRSYKEARLVEIKVGQREEETKLFRSLREIGAMKLENMDLGNDSFGSLVKGLKNCAKKQDKGYGVVNFDTTALVAIVTGISNGCAEEFLKSSGEDMRRRHKGSYDFLMSQAQSEVSRPILSELACLLHAKRGVACETVASEFNSLVAMCGGANEQRRAEIILKCISIIPDCPSDRTMELPTTRKLTMKSKTIFGVGDYLHCPTLTANMAFVRAVAQTGMSLYSIDHRPRALIGD